MKKYLGKKNIFSAHSTTSDDDTSSTIPATPTDTTSKFLNSFVTSLIYEILNVQFFLW